MRVGCQKHWYEKARGWVDPQGITKETKRENCQGKGVTGALGVAIEQAGEDFVVVFYGFRDPLNQSGRRYFGSGGGLP